MACRSTIRRPVVRHGRLTTDDLDRIEVVRGAGGALYGSQAIGGVVNLISAEGSGRPSSATSEGGNRATQHQVGRSTAPRASSPTRARCRIFRPAVVRATTAPTISRARTARLSSGREHDIPRLRALHPLQREPAQLFQSSAASRQSERPSAQRVHALQRRGQSSVRRPARARLSAFFVRDEFRINAARSGAKRSRSEPESETDVPDETRGTNLEDLHVGRGHSLAGRIRFQGSMGRIRRAICFSSRPFRHGS